MLQQASGKYPIVEQQVKRATGVLTLHQLVYVMGTNFLRHPNVFTRK
jgi:hypothetical protein